ncbi:transposase [Streptomyces sp. NBC_00062]|nr:transposase [Streptomyces sp. NBC_00062]
MPRVGLGHPGQQSAPGPGRLSGGLPWVIRSQVRRTSGGEIHRARVGPPPSRGWSLSTSAISIESSERLGRRRWVIERTMSWLTGYRRLNHRYERDPSNYLASRGLAAALCCYKRLHKLTR